MTHDIATLERKIKALHEAMSQLQAKKHTDLLLPIIHRPGWTTVAEFELVQAHVDAAYDHVSNIHKRLDTLVAVAEKIGK